LKWIIEGIDDFATGILTIVIMAGFETTEADEGNAETLITRIHANLIRVKHSR